MVRSSLPFLDGAEYASLQLLLFDPHYLLPVILSNIHARHFQQKRQT